MFTDLINNSYKKQLLEQLAWIKINVSNKSEIEIKQYIVSTLASTAPEYINYGLINKELFNYVK